MLNVLIEIYIHENLKLNDKLIKIFHCIQLNQFYHIWNILNFISFFTNRFFHYVDPQFRFFE